MPNTQLFKILKDLQLASLGTGEYRIEDLESAQQALKSLMLDLVSKTDFAYKDASAYAEVLKQKINAL